jgi:hypothetical protein
MNWHAVQHLAAVTIFMSMTIYENPYQRFLTKSGYSDVKFLDMILCSEEFFCFSFPQTFFFHLLWTIRCDMIPVI